jgi:hypothetical protein
MITHPVSERVFLNVCFHAGDKKMGVVLKYWPKYEILDTLKKLEPINGKLRNKNIISYHKQGKICHITIICTKFGSLNNALIAAGLSHLICTKKERYEIFAKQQTKYTKEKIIELLQKHSKDFETKRLSPTDLITNINKTNKIHLNSACKKFFGTIGNAFKAANIQTKKFYWTQEEILQNLQKKYNEKNGKLCKCDIARVEDMPYPKSIRDKFNGASLDKIAEYAGINFAEFTDFKGTHFTGRKGLKEDFILDKIEEQNNIKLVRQYRVGTKYIDGFHIESNTAYEVDERGHFYPYMQVHDHFRQQLIENRLGCRFVRIKQDDFLSKLNNKTL